MKQGADTGGWAGDGYWLCKTGGGSDSERTEEEQEEMKLGVMSFNRIEKAVSVTPVVKALLQERGREMECF